jgi:threonyl-tRNA synthetase
LSPLLASNIRVFTGASSDKIGAKIRLAQLERVSYMLCSAHEKSEAAKLPCNAARAAIRDL